MKSNLISILFIGTVLILGFGAFKLWTWYEDSAELPYYGKKKEFAANLRKAKAKNFRPVGAFSFINQDSQSISSAEMVGKIWVADFFFTRCPSICPQMTNNLQLVQAAFSNRQDVKIMSFTCDPVHDRPKQLRDYAASFEANPSIWQFVTGEKDLLYRFARNQLYITATDGDAGATDFIHEQYLVLVDKEGYIRGFYDGTKVFEVNVLINDIKKLL